MHGKKVEDILKELESSTKGLSESEARKRLKKYGENKIEQKKGTNPIWIFLNQFNSFIVYILIAATIISAILGEWLDSIVILAILIANGILGFVQEYRAEKSIDALKKLESVKAKVIRDGKEQLIDSSKIVPGDILILEEGDKVSADARLMEVNELQTLEAALTGESSPVTKNISLLKKDTVLADRKNMVFSGTIVTKGRGKCIVTGTGMKTEIGKIANLIQETKEEMTPLQKKLQVLAKWLGIFTIVIAIVVFAVGIYREGLFNGIQKETVVQMFLVAVALAVAAIPEGLPAVVTVSLALGVQRMIKRNALVRKLPSVQTLGSTTVICSDKTGTFTKNQMTVKKIYADGKEISVSGSGYSTKGGFSEKTKSLSMLLQIGMLCNNAQLNEKEVIGDPTEAALLVSGEKSGIGRKKLQNEWKRVHEIVFDSKRKLMSTINKKASKKIMHTKGAPDSIIEKCTKILENGKVRKITSADKKKILKKNEEFAKQALRVLGFAYKEVDGKEHKENNLVFTGLQAMIDPARPEVKEALIKCKKAGIKVVMITGDHKITAEAIAKEIGLEGKAIEGKDLDKINLNKEIDKIAIIARASPEQKIKIIDALKKKGHIVAMTGDGVNDAPALKKADIGISMGINGTEVAKEASDMILTDDNFASIVNAVEEGRGIYDNIKKFVNYLLSSNTGEVLVLFVAMLIGFHFGGKVVVPLLAIHLLWINLVTDGLPALALGVDPHGKGIMERKPRSPKENIIDENMTIMIVVIGVLIAGGTLWLFNHGLGESAIKAQTMAFTALVVFEMVRVYMIRITYKVGIFSNIWLLLAMASSMLLQLMVVYTPLNKVFKVIPLTLVDWGFILGATAALLVIGLVATKIVQLMTHEMD